MDRADSFVVWLGGSAGDGIASVGDILARSAARSGLRLFAHNSYQSVIRGGHVLLQMNISSGEVLSHGGRWDVLVALNQDTADRHAPSAHAAPGRGVLFNSDKIKVADGRTAYPLPVGELTKDFGKNPLIQNTVALGALAHLLGLSWEIVEAALRAQFGKKSSDVSEQNVRGARAGFDHAAARFPRLPGAPLVGDGRRRPVMTGNQAIALGGAAGGMTFYAAYPMTPASSIMHWLAPRAARFGLVMKQAEDELAAMNMAVGAGYAGARAMTGTSGGGFALMTEAIGMAGMLEVPVVVALAQRGGPSTGLPTKTEQADLFQALGASEGDYPKAVIAPLSVADAYLCTTESLNLAEKYQIPVILMSDLYLSEHMETVNRESLPFPVPIERGEIARPGETEGYRRYADTPSGVSPRVFPGTPYGLHVASTDEHNEKGELISDVFTNPSMRVRMVEKRQRKLEGLAREPRALAREGSDQPGITLVGWGSTYQILREARLALEKEGVSVAHVQFRRLWPFPSEEARRALGDPAKVVIVENNVSGQFARLLRQETGISVPRHVRKYDGEPFNLPGLLDALKKILDGSAPEIQRLVSSELDIPVHHLGGAA